MKTSGKIMDAVANGCVQQNNPETRLVITFPIHYSDSLYFKQLGNQVVNKPRISIASNI
jgi:flagellar biosynthesis protein FlhB